VTLLGDLKNGRTVHSLVALLSFYSVRINLVSPLELAMPDSVTAAARKKGILVRQCTSLDEVLADTDVLYVTRVQQERFDDAAEWERVHKAYVVDHAVLARAKADMIIMHPLPRLSGQSFDVSNCTFDLILIFNFILMTDRDRSRSGF
jgi:carbamoyl-phosphate synthase / aspartate carbamoyltransferase